MRVLGRASVAYLRQSQELSGAGTLLDALLEPFADLQRLHEQLIAIEARLGGGDPAELARYGELQERYQREGGYELEARVKRLTPTSASRRRIWRAPVDTLSGGERGRLELAKVLVQTAGSAAARRADQPPGSGGHRTAGGVPGRVPRARSCWCRTTARSSAPSAARSSSWRTGKFVRYPFGYDKYVVERDARLERARAEYERQKEHVDKTEDFIRRNLAGQKTKQAQSRRKMLEKLERLERPDDQWQHAGKIGLRFPDRRRSGRQGDHPRARSITVGYPARRRSCATSTANIYRGDKVGIVGPNGAGKSTLLKTLIGELPPLAGKVEIGTGVRIGYFDQKLGTLDEELYADRRDPLACAPTCRPTWSGSYLAKFRFFGDDPFRTVRGLSGGERSRLAMAKIMLFPRNVLVLDEPTNHLDIPARETLEEALPTTKAR